MDVHYPEQSKCFHSWDESGERTSLLVMLKGASWQLQHIDNRFMQELTTCLTLSVAEVEGVVARIALVRAGKHPENPQDLPRLVVTGDTDGEPYREGVRLALDTGNWEKDFSLTLTNYDAGELEKLLALKPAQT